MIITCLRKIKRAVTVVAAAVALFGAGEVRAQVAEFVGNPALAASTPKPEYRIVVNAGNALFYDVQRMDTEGGWSHTVRTFMKEDTVTALDAIRIDAHATFGARTAVTIWFGDASGTGAGTADELVQHNAFVFRDYLSPAWGDVTLRGNLKWNTDGNKFQYQIELYTGGTQTEPNATTPMTITTYANLTFITSWSYSASVEGGVLSGKLYHSANPKTASKFVVAGGTLEAIGHVNGAIYASNVDVVVTGAQTQVLQGGGTIDGIDAVALHHNSHFTVADGAKVYTAKRWGIYAYNDHTGKITVDGGHVEGNHSGIFLVAGSHSALEIKDGSVKGGVYATIETRGYNTIDISGGTINSKKAVPNADSISLLVKGDGVVTITGGTFESDNAAFRGQDNAVFNISDCTVVAGNYAVYAEHSATFNISGGTFTSTGTYSGTTASYACLFMASNTTVGSELNISGGTFTCAEKGGNGHGVQSGGAGTVRISGSPSITGGSGTAVNLTANAKATITGSPTLDGRIATFGGNFSVVNTGGANTFAPSQRYVVRVMNPTPSCVAVVGGSAFFGSFTRDTAGWFHMYSGADIALNTMPSGTPVYRIVNGLQGGTFTAEQLFSDDNWYPLPVASYATPQAALGAIGADVAGGACMLWFGDNGENPVYAETLDIGNQRLTFDAVGFGGCELTVSGKITGIDSIGKMLTFDGAVTATLTDIEIENTQGPGVLSKSGASVTISGEGTRITTAKDALAADGGTLVVLDGEITSAGNFYAVSVTSNAQFPTVFKVEGGRVENNSSIFGTLYLADIGVNDVVDISGGSVINKGTGTVIDYIVGMGQGDVNVNVSGDAELGTAGAYAFGNGFTMGMKGLSLTLDDNPTVGGILKLNAANKVSLVAGANLAPENGQVYPIEIVGGKAGDIAVYDGADKGEFFMLVNTPGFVLVPGRGADAAHLVLGFGPSFHEVGSPSVGDDPFVIGTINPGDLGEDLDGTVVDVVLTDDEGNTLRRRGTLRGPNGDGNYDIVLDEELEAGEYMIETVTLDPDGEDGPALPLSVGQPLTVGRSCWVKYTEEDVRAGEDGVSVGTYKPTTFYTGDPETEMTVTVTLGEGSAEVTLEAVLVCNGDGTYAIVLTQPIPGNFAGKRPKAFVTITADGKTYVDNAEGELTVTGGEIALVSTVGTGEADAKVGEYLPLEGWDGDFETDLTVRVWIEGSEYPAYLDGSGNVLLETPIPDDMCGEELEILIIVSALDTGIQLALTEGTLTTDGTDWQWLMVGEIIVPPTLAANGADVLLSWDTAQIAWNTENFRTRGKGIRYVVYTSDTLLVPVESWDTFDTTNDGGILEREVSPQGATWERIRILGSGNDAARFYKVKAVKE